MKIIKKQIWKSKFSYSNCFFSDDDCKFGTHVGKSSAEAEFFSLEVQKWLKKDFFRKSLFFQMFNKSIGHVEYTFGFHAKKIPQRGCSLFAKPVTLIRKCFWKVILFLKLLIQPSKMHFWKARKKTFYKTRKTSSSRSEDDEKKLVFPNKIFSFHWTCRKHFWQSCRKVYVRTPIIFRSMFGNDRNKTSTKTFFDSKKSLGCWESSFENSTQNCSTKKFCSDGRES